MTIKQRILLPLLAVGGIAIANLAIAAEEVVLATVNGSKITQEDFQRFVFEATQGVKGNPQINPQDVMSELLSRELIYQDAMKQGLAKRKDVQEEIERLKYKLLVGVALEEAVKKRPITDKELQALYDKEVKNVKRMEYKARHILVADKALAEQIITELDLGGDFAKLAEKHSTDAGSKKNGGDLDWFKPQQMVPEFSNAVMLMDKGKHTKVPVQSQYGWHVIKLEDSRELPTPSFEQVKPKLAQVLQQQRVTEYVTGLKDKAEIKITEK